MQLISSRKPILQPKITWHDAQLLYHHHAMIIRSHCYAQHKIRPTVTDVAWSVHLQGMKVCRYNWHSVGSLCWPFPMLKYKYLFQIKYMAAILMNQLGNCHGLKLPKCWLQLKNQFIVLFIVIFVPCWSTTVKCAIMAQTIKMPFGVWTRVGHRNQVLDEGPDPLPATRTSGSHNRACQDLLAVDILNVSH